MKRILHLMRPWIINAGLLGLVVFFGMKTYNLWTADYVPAPGKHIKQSPDGFVKLPPVRSPVPPRTRYITISKNNLFSQDRTSPPGDSGAGDTGAASAEPVAIDLKLYGIVIEGQVKKALILNPEDRLRSDLIWVRVGDQVGRYSVKDVQAERLLVTNGSDTYSVWLGSSDPAVPQQTDQGIRALRQTPGSGSDGAQHRQPAARTGPRTRFIPAD